MFSPRHISDIARLNAVTHSCFSVERGQLGARHPRHRVVRGGQHERRARGAVLPRAVPLPRGECRGHVFTSNLRTFFAPVQLHERTFVCACTHKIMDSHTHTHTHTHTPRRTHTNMTCRLTPHTYTHTNTQQTHTNNTHTHSTHTHTAHTHTNADPLHIHTLAHTHTHAPTHKCRSIARAHTHTHTNTHTHTHTHTHSCTWETTSCLVSVATVAAERTTAPAAGGGVVLGGDAAGAGRRRRRRGAGGEGRQPAQPRAAALHAAGQGEDESGTWEVEVTRRWSVWVVVGR